MEDRTSLVEDFLPFIERTARRLARGAPRCSTSDDLESAGVCGLLEAAGRSRDDRTFAAFARARIVGAMQDEIRALDERGRALRERGAALAAGGDALRRELGREPTLEELAERLGTSAERLDVERALAQPVLVLSRLATELGMENTTDDTSEIARGLLSEAVAALPEREQRVLGLIYADDLSQREAAAALGVSVGRLARIHTTALFRLRHHMRRARS